MRQLQVLVSAKLAAQLIRIHSFLIATRSVSVLPWMQFLVISKVYQEQQAVEEVDWEV
jgi:hypothetical protein